MFLFRWLTTIRVGGLRLINQSIRGASERSAFPLSTLLRLCSRQWISLQMPFYAVRKGRKVGIYETWTECEAQVKKFAGAQFKKFATLNEAQDFITCQVADSVLNFDSGTSAGRKRNYNVAAGSQVSEEEPSTGSETSSTSKRQRTLALDDSGLPYTVVYTDGACTNNGNGGARGGIGVYWGPDDARNVSEPLPRGRQTNNRAEILACARAIEQATKNGMKRLEIRTDSRFTITCMTVYLSKWLKNGWVTQGGKPVLNMEELIVLHKHKSKFEQDGGQLRFVHVSGHSGEPGNEAADRLAVDGIRKTS